MKFSFRQDEDFVQIVQLGTIIRDIYTKGWKPNETPHPWYTLLQSMNLAVHGTPVFGDTH